MRYSMRNVSMAGSCRPKGMYSAETRVCHGEQSVRDRCSSLIVGVLIEKGTKVSVFATLQHVRRHALVTDFHKVDPIKKSLIIVRDRWCIPDAKRVLTGSRQQWIVLSTQFHWERFCSCAQAYFRSRCSVPDVTRPCPRRSVWFTASRAFSGPGSGLFTALQERYADDCAWW